MFKALQVSQPDRVFTVDMLAGPNTAYDRLEHTLQSHERPVLVTSMAGAKFDAYVYFGNSPDVGISLDPDAAIYSNTPYGAEVARRRKIMVCCWR